MLGGSFQRSELKDFSVPDFFWFWPYVGVNKSNITVAIIPLQFHVFCALMMETQQIGQNFRSKIYVSCEQKSIFQHR